MQSKVCCGFLQPREKETTGTQTQLNSMTLQPENDMPTQITPTGRTIHTSDVYWCFDYYSVFNLLIVPNSQHEALTQSFACSFELLRANDVSALLLQINRSQTHRLNFICKSTGHKHTGFISVSRLDYPKLTCFIAWSQTKSDRQCFCQRFYNYR